MPSLYYTLLASLPPLPRSIVIERMPISRVRLDERLKMLEEHDAELLRELRLLLSLPGIDQNMIAEHEEIEHEIRPVRKRTIDTETEFVAHFESKIALMKNRAAIKVVGEYFDTLLILNAMIRRMHDMPPLENDRPIAVHIKRYWRRNYFALDDQYRWIAEVEHRLRDGDMLAVYRILLEDLHRQWGLASCLTQFSPDALVLYIARWELLNHWASLDADQGKKTIDTIVKEAIGDYDQYFA